MSVISGVNGAIYWNEEITDIASANDIAFSSGAGTIVSDLDIDFETVGFKAGMLVTVSGSTGNDGTYTIDTVSSGTLTVTEAVTSSTGELNVITFTEAEPGYQEAGFYNWTINYKIALLDSTAFDTSSGGRSYVSGITDWTASAEKFFISSGDAINDWLGETIKVRFFINYVATPSTGSPSVYYQGNTIVTGIDQGTPVDALITQGIGFQGVNALSLVIRTTAWNS